MSDLHLKVRGVALWLKTLQGQAPAIVDSAFETLLLAADRLAAQESANGASASPDKPESDEPGTLATIDGKSVDLRAPWGVRG